MRLRQELIREFRFVKLELADTVLLLGEDLIIQNKEGYSINGENLEINGLAYDVHEQPVGNGQIDLMFMDKPLTSIE